MTVQDALRDVQRPKAIGPKWPRMEALYRLVRRLQPVHCLEYGSGWSTLAIALALRDNGQGTLVSCEAQEKWGALTQQNLIDLELDACATVNMCDVVQVESGGVNGWVYLSNPARMEFVHVDGPALDKTCKVTHVTANLKPGAVIVLDGRAVTAAHYDTVYSRIASKGGQGFYAADLSGIDRYREAA